MVLDKFSTFIRIGAPGRVALGLRMLKSINPFQSGRDVVASIPGKQPARPETTPDTCSLLIL